MANEHIALHPRIAPDNTRLRVWLGVFEQTITPVPTWELDGNAAVPAPLRSISSVRQGDLLFPEGTPPAGAPPEGPRRAFTGVYEFSGLQPGSLHHIAVQVSGGRRTILTRTLPASLPQGLDQWFNVLVVSCFHFDEDKNGRAGTLVSSLPPGQRPDATFLVGDQVYLDLPTLQNFPDDALWMADKFERDYVRNWRMGDSEPSGYGHILAAAPSVSIPDDHEYWNNFPNIAPAIQNSWSQGGRRRWRRAAEASYKGFQLPLPLDAGDPFLFDVSPLSFFLADMRHQRSEGTARTMSAAAHQQLSDWVDDLIARRHFGVFVSGQSLFADAQSRVLGAVGDYRLANYDDYPEIVNNLLRLVDAGLALVCVTGDVHWGRMTSAQDLNSGRTAVYEVISSPSSLVTVVGLDQLQRARALLKDLFGPGDPWPRHPSTQAPPDFLAKNLLLGRRIQLQSPDEHHMRGNHVAMLGFRQKGGGVEMRVVYHEIPRAGPFPASRNWGHFDLKAM